MFDFSGTWKSSYFFSDIMISCIQNHDRVYGLVELCGMFGKKDVYHFEGKVKGDAVTAWHHSGRHFEGQATGKNMAAGTLFVRSGARLGIKARRVSLKRPTV